MAFAHYLKEWETSQRLCDECVAKAKASLIEEYVKNRVDIEYIPLDIEEKVLTLRRDW